jgi:hypothetical protein
MHRLRHRRTILGLLSACLTLGMVAVPTSSADDPLEPQDVLTLSQATTIIHQAVEQNPRAFGPFHSTITFETPEGPRSMTEDIQFVRYGKCFKAKVGNPWWCPVVVREEHISFSSECRIETNLWNIGLLTTRHGKPKKPNSGRQQHSWASTHFDGKSQVWNLWSGAGPQAAAPKGMPKHQPC